MDIKLLNFDSWNVFEEDPWFVFKCFDLKPQLNLLEETEVVLLWGVSLSSSSEFLHHDENIFLTIPNIWDYGITQARDLYYNHFIKLIQYIAK